MHQMRRQEPEAAKSGPQSRRQYPSTVDYRAGGMWQICAFKT